MVFVLAALVARSAYADPLEDQVARGEELARQGAWTQAIDHFKQADKLAPRAKHACLIGLAYSRRELWAEAELFFELCHARSSASDPLPEWLADAETQLATRLAESNAAPITITVGPATATPKVRVSSFAPDETFTPRTIHLAPGTHAITIEAPGYDTERRELVVTDAKPQTLAVMLHEPYERSPVPMYVVGAGAAIALAGLAVDLFALRPIAEDEGKATSQYQYDQLKAAHTNAFARDQKIMIGLFATAAVVATVGVVLRFTVYRHREREVVRVGAAPVDRGGALVVEWTP